MSHKYWPDSTSQRAQGSMQGESDRDRPGSTAMLVLSFAAPAIPTDTQSVLAEAGASHRSCCILVSTGNFPAHSLAMPTWKRCKSLSLLPTLSWRGINTGLTVLRSAQLLQLACHPPDCGISHVWSCALQVLSCITFDSLAFWLQ